MAEFSANLHQRFKDFIATSADADSSQASARIVASGESTSVKLNMTSSVGDDGALTILSASTEVETDGSTLLVTGDAAATGETASTSLDLIMGLQEKLAVAQVIAEAEGDGAVTTATATASTNAATSPDFEIVEFQQETVETPGDNPTAVSRTYLEAVRNEPFALDPLPPSEESAPIETGNADSLF